MILPPRLDVVWTLFWHRFVPRGPRDGLRLAWVFLEPAGQIAIMLAVFAFVGRSGGYGPSFALFLATGVVILSIVNRAAALVSGTVVALRRPKRPVAIGPFDDALAAAGFKLVTALVYTPLIAVGIALWQQVPVLPQAPGAVLAALAIATLLGFGLGLVRGVSERLARPVAQAIGVISRALLFVSGVFYMPDALPPEWRGWLAWNPVLQAVELMRRGVYGADYPSTAFDARYLALVALLTVVAGVLLVQASRARLMDDA